ncbi:hypothetical protein DPMN_053984 [Dreissena polymorpha]|uniref:Uncharacterized protein n=1 Tax=Dreissena polymorpha TaxID=45954 RepID=A0A9D4HSP7_DREPO|nr:hypothetical protein DPMN_053984 [Dreissena polymorpha]
MQDAAYAPNDVDIHISNVDIHISISKYIIHTSIKAETGHRPSTVSTQLLTKFGEDRRGYNLNWPYMPHHLPNTPAQNPDKLSASKKNAKSPGIDTFPWSGTIFQVSLDIIRAKFNVLTKFHEDWM